jgi:SAM-dependent methyltransferase
VKIRRVAQTPYDTSYYERNKSGSDRSAAVVVPMVLELLEPQSVVDVGCGAGSWLRVFNDHGVEDIQGIDGDYVDRAQLEIPEERFLPRDLSKGVQLDRRFDLAVSLEVAEHLPPEAAETLVDSLVGLAPAVLFSAAIPGQGGAGHVNEQWPNYWVGHFENRGYVCVDCIRPRIWGELEVETWYIQNILLMVEPSVLEARPRLAQERERYANNQLLVIHPRLVNRWPPRMMLRRLHRMGLLTDDEFEVKRLEADKWERERGYA